jgi:hypothetical protein
VGEVLIKNEMPDWLDEMKRYDEMSDDWDEAF